jgi:hypothetical protein
MSTIKSVVLSVLAGTAVSASAQNAGSVHAETLLTVAQTSVLTLTSNNAQQQIEVEVGPLPGEVRVFGFNGGSEMSYTGVTAINLRTGSAQDFVEFRIYTPAAPAITLNTGASNSDVKFIYFTPGAAGAASSDVTITGGTGNDIVNFEVFSEAADFAANWTVNQGNGDNEVNAVVNSTQVSSSLTLDLTATQGLGQDKASFNVIGAAASTDIGYVARQGAGNDTATFNFDEQTPGAAFVFLDINGAAGQDTAEAVAVTRGGTAAFSGRILGGNDADFAKLLLEGAGSSSVQLNGGAGADYLDSEYKGAVTGSPRLLGLDGDDFLKIVADQPALLRPTLDGGLGFDIAIGFGRIINCEQIN